MKYIKGFLIFAILIVFTYFVVGQLFLPQDAPDNNYDYKEFVSEWYQVKSDGTKIPVEIPGVCEAERNEVVTIETVIPKDIEDNTFLCFRSAKQDVWFYVDGELRSEYSTKETRLFGNTSATVYVFLEINATDAGKKLVVQTQTDSSYSGIFYTIYCGERMGVWNYFFELYGSELVIAFLTLVLGVVSIIGCIALRICFHRRMELEHLGWGIVLAAVWLITNSVFRQLIFPNISVVGDMTFLMIMLLPLPFLLYMNGVQKDRYQKVYCVFGGIAICSFVIFSLLHITKVKDFVDTIAYIAGICVLSIVWMGITIVMDIYKKHIKEYSLVAVGILGACLASILQIVMYFKRTTVFSGVMMALGLIFLLITAVINTIRDILDMESEKQQAVSASLAKAKFLANMSHEIRTPINAVLGMDAMILRESGDIRIKEYALDIQNAGQSLLALINDILDFSKIESGKMEIVSAEYDFSSMIHDIFNMISIKAEAKDLTMQLFIEENLPSRLIGDDIRIRQILVNLLNNAVKYTHSGGVTLTVRGEKRDETVCLHFMVEDTGIGIKEEDFGKLFEEFERIEEQRNRNIEGTGLGMNITLQLLEMMGSKLQVESVYGEGSKFFFELEQQIADAEPIGNLEERIRQQTREYSYQAMFTAPDADVLVVDDNGVNRKVFKNLLKETRMRIEDVSSGEECLELVTKKHYDIIFLDHMMPDMDGIETLHRMQEWEDYPCKDVPVVVLTANAIAGAKEMYLSEGFDGFLSKPIIPDKLEKMLVEMLPEDKIIFGEYQDDMVLQKLDEDAMLRVEELPVIEGIDWEYGLLHLKSAELLRDTVEDFYHLMDTEAATLEKLYGQIENRAQLAESECVDAQEGYRIKVHTMKTAAATIGAIALSGVARLLEKAAQENTWEIVDKVTPIFLKEWRIYKEKLAVCIKEETLQKQTMDVEEVENLLRTLSIAMEDMDVDAADEVMDCLKRFEYSEEMQKKVDALGVVVLNLDGEETSRMVVDIISGL